MAISDHIGKGESGMEKVLRETNQLSINIFLTEKFLGKCWHDWGWQINPICSKCQETSQRGGKQVDLFTPEGFFLLWNKAQEQTWWHSLAEEQEWTAYYKVEDDELPSGYYIPQDLVNPLTFPTLLAEYLGWKE